jgi:transposase-like protein
MVSRRTFTREFKLDLCRDLDSGSLRKGEACRKHALSLTLVNNWLSQYHAKGEEAFQGADWRALSLDPETRTRDLEAALGRAHLEIELLKAALEKKPSLPRSGAK